MADCRMQEEIFSVARALSAVLPCVSAGTPAILKLERGRLPLMMMMMFLLPPPSNHPGSSALGRFILFFLSSSSLLCFYFPLSLSPTLALVEFSGSSPSSVSLLLLHDCKRGTSLDAYHPPRHPCHTSTSDCPCHVILHLVCFKTSTCHLTRFGTSISGPSHFTTSVKTWMEVGDPSYPPPPPSHHSHATSSLF